MCDNNNLIYNDVVCQKCTKINWYTELNNGRLMCLDCDIIIILHKQKLTTIGTSVDYDLYDLIEWLEKHNIYINGNCQHQTISDKGDLCWINIENFDSYDRLVKYTKMNNCGLMDIYLNNVKICIKDKTDETKKYLYDDLNIVYNFSWKFPLSQLKRITNIITSWK